MIFVAQTRGYSKPAPCPDHARAQAMHHLEHHDVILLTYVDVSCACALRLARDRDREPDQRFQPAHLSFHSRATVNALHFLHIQDST